MQKRNQLCIYRNVKVNWAYPVSSLKGSVPFHPGRVSTIVWEVAMPENANKRSTLKLIVSGAILWFQIAPQTQWAGLESALCFWYNVSASFLKKFRMNYWIG